MMQSITFMIHRKIYWIYFTFLISLNYTFSQVDTLNLPPGYKEERIYKVVEEMPYFPGCKHVIAPRSKKDKCSRDKLSEYVYNMLFYPDEALRKNIEGVALVQFIIWKDSTLRDIKVLRDPGGGIGKEALRIVESMRKMKTKWTPGKHKGNPVCVRYILPIKFQFKEKNYDVSDIVRKSNYQYEKVYKRSELFHQPLFPDCKKQKGKKCTEESLKSFISENQIYPDEAIENKTEGVVVVTFIIEKDGSLSNITTTKNLPDGLSQDAVEIFKWMNSEGMRWTPGQFKYKNVRTRYSVEVPYSIKDWLSRQ